MNNKEYNKIICSCCKGKSVKKNGTRKTENRGNIQRYKCRGCSSGMKEFFDKTPEGAGYKYFKCTKCGEEILNMEQLHNVADSYRKIKKYHIKLSKWGLSLGIRIPKEVVEKYKLKNNEDVIIIPDEGGIKVVPA